MHTALLALKAKVGSLSFNFRHDLFAWTECCTECFMKPDDGKPALCALVMMVVLYGFGIALFFLHLQYNQYCEDNLTTIGANAVNVTCAGWTEECRLWGTTISLKAYLQYRAAAYVLLLCGEGGGEPLRLAAVSAAYERRVGVVPDAGAPGGCVLEEDVAAHDPAGGASVRVSVVAL